MEAVSAPKNKIVLQNKNNEQTKTQKTDMLQGVSFIRVAINTNHNYIFCYIANISINSPKEMLNCKFGIKLFFPLLTNSCLWWKTTWFLLLVFSASSS